MRRGWKRGGRESERKGTGDGRRNLLPETGDEEPGATSAGMAVNADAFAIHDKLGFVGRTRTERSAKTVEAEQNEPKQKKPSRWQRRTC
jgi:hypothetical protein